MCINYKIDLQGKGIIWVTLEAGRALIPSSTAPTISYIFASMNFHLKDLSIKKKPSQKSQTRLPAWFMTYQPYWCLCAVEGRRVEEAAGFPWVVLTVWRSKKILFDRIFLCAHVWLES